MQFKYYVLNYDFNKKKVGRFNIFRNIRVQEWTEKAVKKYLRSPKMYVHINYGFGNEGNEVVKGFDALCLEIRSILMNQLWSRREYEISVCDAFEDDINKLEKWDVFQQCELNIPVIAREVIYQYKQQKKNKQPFNDLQPAEIPVGTWGIK